MQRNNNTIPLPKICIKNITSKYILAQIDATRSLADSSAGYMENSIKNIRMTIVESNPTVENIYLAHQTENVYFNYIICILIFFSTTMTEDRKMKILMVNRLLSPKN